jgi:hypothetical protein
MIDFFANVLAATLTLALAVCIVFGALLMPNSLRTGLLVALALQSLGYIVSSLAARRRGSDAGQRAFNHDQPHAIPKGKQIRRP